MDKKQELVEVKACPEEEEEIEIQAQENQRDLVMVKEEGKDKGEIDRR